MQSMSPGDLTALHTLQADAQVKYIHIKCCNLTHASASIKIKTSISPFATLAIYN